MYEAELLFREPGVFRIDLAEVQVEIVRIVLLVSQGQDSLKGLVVLVQHLHGPGLGLSYFPDIAIVGDDVLGQAVHIVSQDDTGIQQVPDLVGVDDLVPEVEEGGAELARVQGLVRSGKDLIGQDGGIQLPGFGHIIGGVHIQPDHPVTISGLRLAGDQSSQDEFRIPLQSIHDVLVGRGSQSSGVDPCRGIEVQVQVQGL